jgi:DNA-binding CsgD family transcriptional regulator
MAERPSEVAIVSRDPLLGPALAAALATLGWRLGPPDRRVVLVAGTDGRLLELGAGYLGRRVVAVGGREAWPALLDAVVRLGARPVLDADQPFPDLVTALDGALRAAGPGDGRQSLARALRWRLAEARLCAALTAREQEVLGSLAEGLAAAEIAAASHVSLATVRSQIRAVLAKLGVSSQLAAVALARRSCREPLVLERFRRIHQI